MLTLELHPEKTKVVFCKDGRRTEDYELTKFVFLGYEFRSRQCRNGKGQFFVGFTPAVSPKARKSMSQRIRSWEIIRRVPLTIEELADQINPVVRGWMNYYGQYCRSELSPTLRHVELTIAKWVVRKYKKLHRRLVAATRWLASLRRREPKLFAHWSWGALSAE